MSIPRGVLLVATLVALLGLTAFLSSLVVIYVGDAYVRPTLSEQSVPPPRPR